MLWRENLLKCTHSLLSHIRGIFFLESLYSINSNFTNMSSKALFLYMSMCVQNILNLSASLYWKYSKLLCIRTLIKLSYHTSSVEAVHSQVIFSFMIIFNCSFLPYLTFILLFFICYCFGTEIFLSKIKSIKLLYLFQFWRGGLTETGG